MRSLEYKACCPKKKNADVGRVLNKKRTIFGIKQEKSVTSTEVISIQPKINK